MTLADLEHFRNLLLEKEQNVLSLLGSTPNLKGDEIRKAQSLLGEIKESLSRINKHSYGECEVCKGEVELYRLEVQPVLEVCLSCITTQERVQLEEDLFLASKIHRALLPQTVEKIDGFEVAVKSLAARTVGGDYYDFIRSSDNDNMLIIVGDAMGKGLPAGLLMSNVQGALRVLAEDFQSPQALISRLNRWLCRNIPVTKFISLVGMSIEFNSAQETRLNYVNAGHCAPLIVRGNGNVESLGQTGGVLGVHEGFTYDGKEFSLYPGDLMLLYTDGITEAENAAGEMFGDERLKALAANLRGNAIASYADCLVNEIQEFTGKPELSDDLTIIALRRL